MLAGDVDALKGGAARRAAARREFEGVPTGAEAMAAHHKLMIARMKRDRFGASAKRGRKLLDQLKLQLDDLQTSAAEDEVAASAAA